MQNGTEVRQPITISYEKRKEALYEFRLHGSCDMERVKGIEPSPQAWEAGVLPLNYTRMLLKPEQKLY